MSEAQVPNFTNSLSRATSRIYQESFVSGIGVANPFACFNWDITDLLVTQHVGWAPPGAFGAATEGRKPDTRAVQERRTKTFTQVDYNLAYAVTRRMRRFADPSALGRFFSQIGLSGGQLFASTMWGLIAAGFSDTGGDGVSLFHASHPTNTGTYSNYAASGLDFAALAAARALGRRLKSPDGMVASVEFACLCVPPEKADVAMQLTTGDRVDKELQPLTTSGAFQVMMVPYFASTTQWFLLAPPAQHELWTLISESPSPRMYEEQGSDNLVMDAWASFVVGYNDARGTFGSNP